MTAKQRQTDWVDETLITDLALHEQTDIGPLLEPYRRELLLHCYRLLGSLHDAEDAVQETMLRAWRHFGTFTFKGPGSLRTWLYTIATNVCLDALKKRGPRSLPTITYPAADPLVPMAKHAGENLWLEPFPDIWLTEAMENPEARYTRSESVSLAFLTALQLLPPRQRAILILSDVLDWHAGEVAQLLELSVSAVNSALHRARVTLEKNYYVEKQERSGQTGADEETHALLARYLRAWETDDVDGLVALLKEDATLSMPPIPAWYWGREAIRAFLPTTIFQAGVQKRWRLCPTRANAQPAFVLYRANETTQAYQAFGIQVITLAGTQVAEVTAFLDSRLATAFGFPLQLPN